MKKIICILLILTFAASFAGCSKNESASKKAQTSTTGVNDILNSTTGAALNAAPTQIDIPVNSGLKTQNAGTPDIDLTVLNANMIYSQLYDMTTKPEEYEGKRIKVSGTFNTYKDEATGNLYFNCFVADAAACCQQGIEFALTDEYKYPSDYPVENAPITVSGIFETYMEGDAMFCHLKDAVFAA